MWPWGKSPTAPAKHAAHGVGGDRQGPLQAPFSLKEATAFCPVSQSRRRTPVPEDTLEAERQQSPRAGGCVSQAESLRR